MVWYGGKLWNTMFSILRGAMQCVRIAKTFQKTKNMQICKIWHLNSQALTHHKLS